MANIQFVIIALIVLSVGFRQVKVEVTPSPQYCQTEVFPAKCADNEVILITSALYGRMRIGRCVKQTLGYIGCHSDVVRELDSMCSGRRECSVSVPNSRLEDTHPCQGELKNYLEVTYECIKVIAPMNTCTGTSPIRLTKPEGYVSSSVAAVSGCGLEGSPWILEGKEGQKISVTLYDFNVAENSAKSLTELNVGESQCSEYAFLLDTYAKRKVKVCPSYKRISEVYTSENNTLHVTFLLKRVLDDQQQLLLYFQVIGCSPLSVPNDMVFERLTWDTARVRCVNGNIIYHLTCQRGQWIGDYQNCSKHGFEPSALPEDHGVTLGGVMLIIFVAIGLLAGFSVMSIFVYCVYRSRRARRDQAIAMSYREPHCAGTPNSHAELIYACKSHHSHDLIAETPDLGGGYTADYGYRVLPTHARTISHMPRCAHCEEFLRDTAFDESCAVHGDVCNLTQEMCTNMQNERIYIPVRSPKMDRTNCALRVNLKDNNLDCQRSDYKNYEKPTSPILKMGERNHAPNVNNAHLAMTERNKLFHNGLTEKTKSPNINRTSTNRHCAPKESCHTGTL